jgi:hypothetical protein
MDFKKKLLIEKIEMFSITGSIYNSIEQESNSSKIFFEHEKIIYIGQDLLKSMQKLKHWKKMIISKK